MAKRSKRGEVSLLTAPAEQDVETLGGFYKRTMMATAVGDRLVNGDARVVKSHPTQTVPYRHLVEMIRARQLILVSPSKVEDIDNGMIVTVKGKDGEQVTVKVEERFKQHKSFRGFCNAILDSKSFDSERVKRGNDTLEKVYKTGYVTRPGNAVQKSAMGETSGTIGGYLVPTEYTAQLMRTYGERSIIYPRAFIWPMNSAVAQCPVVDATTAQAEGTAPYYGGVKFSWGASQAPGQTEPTFRQVNLTAWDLLGYSVVSNQWLQDVSEPVELGGPTGEQKLVEAFGAAAAWYTDKAFVDGEGADSNMPLGVMNSPATIEVARDSSAHITATTIAAMAARLLPYCWEDAIWLTHPTCLADIVKLATYTVNNGNITHPAACGTLVTRPLFVTDKVPPMGTRGDLLLMGPSMYAVGLRQEVLIDVSGDVPGLFQNYQTAFRVWMRCDGKPVIDKPVTLTDATNTASCAVVVATG